MKEETRDVIITVTISTSIIAIMILVHQVINWGMWWKWSDFLHHENFAAVMFAFSGGVAFVFVSVWWFKQKQKEKQNQLYGGERYGKKQRSP